MPGSSATTDGTRTLSGRAGGVPTPPFHTPVFVLTHHPRPSIEMEGGTTFHFLDASPTEALETAREATDGQDLRLGGGATVIRDFLAAGLVAARPWSPPPTCAR
jgi:dihydrofolate reductase